MFDDQSATQAWFCTLTFINVAPAEVWLAEAIEMDRSVKEALPV